MYIVKATVEEGKGKLLNFPLWLGGGKGKEKTWTKEARVLRAAGDHTAVGWISGRSSQRQKSRALACYTEAAKLTGKLNISFIYLFIHILLSSCFYYLFIYVFLLSVCVCVCVWGGGGGGSACYVERSTSPRPIFF